MGGKVSGIFGVKGWVGWVGSGVGEKGFLAKKMMDGGKKKKIMGFCGCELKERAEMWILKKSWLERREGTENAMGTMPRVGEEP